MERKPDQLFRCCFLARQHSAAFLNQMPSRWVSYGEWIYGLCSPCAHGAHQLGKGVAQGFDQPPLMLSKNSDGSSDPRQEDAKLEVAISRMGVQEEGPERLAYNSKAEKASPAERTNEDHELH